MTLTPQQLFFDLGKLKVIGMKGQMSLARNLVQTALATGLSFDDINPGNKGADRDKTQWMHDLLLWGMTVVDFDYPGQGLSDEGHPSALRTTHALAGSILLLAAIGEVYKPRGRAENDTTPPFPDLPAKHHPFNQRWKYPEPIQSMPLAERLAGCLGELMPEYKEPDVNNAFFSILRLSLTGIDATDNGFHRIMGNVAKILEHHTYGWGAQALSTADKHLNKTVKTLFANRRRDWKGHEVWTREPFLHGHSATKTLQTLQHAEQAILEKNVPSAKTTPSLKKVRL